MPWNKVTLQQGTRSGYEASRNVVKGKARPSLLLVGDKAQTADSQPVFLMSGSPTPALDPACKHPPHEREISLGLVEGTGWGSGREADSGNCLFTTLSGRASRGRKQRGQANIQGLVGWLPGPRGSVHRSPPGRAGPFGIMPQNHHFTVLWRTVGTYRTTHTKWSCPQMSRAQR